MNFAHAEKKEIIPRKKYHSATWKICNSCGGLGINPFATFIFS